MGACAPSPSRPLTRPGRLRAEEILLYFGHATRQCDFCFLLLESFFAGDQQQLGTPPSSVPRQCCAVGIAVLLCLVIKHRQFWAVSRRHLCWFDQNCLQMFVALLRERCALGDIGRTSFRAAQSAAADGLLDRGKSFHVANFKCPSQYRDRANRRNGHEPFYAFHKQRVTLQRPH